MIINILGTSVMVLIISKVCIAIDEVGKELEEKQNFNEEEYKNITK